MKNLLFIAAFLTSTVSFAAATCPAESETFAICNSTPKAGDPETASNTFDSIAICAKGAATKLVLEKGGQIYNAEPKVTQRDGGTTYLLESADVDVSFHVVTGIVSKLGPATLQINLKSANIVMSSSYTCSR